MSQSTHVHATLSRPLMTVSEAATFLNVSRRQLYYLLEREGLPAVRVGARLRFHWLSLKSSSSATESREDQG